MSGYSVVLADPPWSFGAWSAPGKGRTAAAHYQTMGPADLEAMGSWIISITAGNSALFLWTTCSTLPQAIALMPQWGYEFRTVAFVWLKLAKRPAAAMARPIMSADGHGDRRLHFGMGHYTRSQTELCLLGIRGRMPVADKAVRQVIAAPVGRHSAKPDEQYPLIHRLYPDGSRLELFARQRAPGWDVWGSEAPESIAGGPTA